MNRCKQNAARKKHEAPNARKALLFLPAFGVWAFSASTSGCLYPDDYTFDDGTNASSSSSTSTSSSGGSGTENCLNGQDDDKDGQIDCADSDCAAPAFQCVAATPIGWTGYFALYEGPSGSAPACPAVFPTSIPYEGNNGIMAPAAQCASCACGVSMNEACDLPDAITVTEKACNNQGSVVSAKNLGVPVDWDGSCYGTGLAQGNLATCGAAANETCNKTVKSGPATTKGGSCTATGGEPTLDPVAWMTTGKACGNAPAGGGCGSGEACQPTVSGGYKSGLCIYKEGEQGACPGAPFSEMHVFYEAADDTRACDACACMPPVGGTCTANIDVYSDAACTVSLNATFGTGNCASLGAANPTVSGRKASGIFVTPGTCSPQGGQPTGTAIPSKATTFCCIP